MSATGFQKLPNTQLPTVTPNWGSPAPAKTSTPTITPPAPPKTFTTPGGQTIDWATGKVIPPNQSSSESGSPQTPTLPPAPTGQNASTPPPATYNPDGSISSSDYGKTVQTPQGPTFVGTPNAPSGTGPNAVPTTPGSPSTPQNPLIPSSQAVSDALKTLGQTPQSMQAGELAFEDQSVAAAQGIIDQIKSSFNAEISTAAGNAAAAAASEGMAGSPEAGQMVSSAMAPATQQQAQAVSQALLSIRDTAATHYEALQSAGTTNAEQTLSLFQNIQTSLTKNAQQIGAAGMTPDQLQQSNPNEYNYLLQFGFNGDAALMQATMLSANTPNVVNASSPLMVGSTANYITQSIGPDGKPTFSVKSLDLSGILQQGEQIVTYNNNPYAQSIGPDGSISLRPLAPVAPVSAGAGGSYVYDPNTGQYTYDNSILSGGATQNGSTPADNSNGSILSATGLSVQAFNYLTQGVSSMSRMPLTERNAILNEAQNWLNKNGIDVSTFQTQYNAYNQTLQGNILRYNASKIQENELLGTINNLQSAMTEGDFSNITAQNLADLYAGKQVQNPAVTKYSTLLLNMQSELAGYLAATRGNLSSSGGPSPDQSDMADAAAVIESGLGPAGLSGFKDAITTQTDKMNTVLQSSVNNAQQQVWNLFGVGSQYSPANESGGSQNNGTSQNSTTMQPAGTIITYQGQQYQVGADGNTLIPYTGQ